MHLINSWSFHRNIEPLCYRWPMILPFQGILVLKGLLRKYLVNFIGLKYIEVKKNLDRVLTCAIGYDRDHARAPLQPSLLTEGSFAMWGNAGQWTINLTYIKQ